MIVGSIPVIPSTIAYLPNWTSSARFAIDPTNASNNVMSTPSTVLLMNYVPNAGVYSPLSSYPNTSRIFVSAKVKYNLKKSPSVSDTSGSQVITLLGQNGTYRYAHIRVDVDTSLVLVIYNNSSVVRIRPNTNITEASWDSISSKWVKIDLDFTPNTTTVVNGINVYNSDGSAKMWVNGVLVLNVVDQKFIIEPSIITTVNNPYPTYVSLCRRINPLLRQVSGTRRIAIDDVTIIQTPARIEIGNASTLAACTVRNICPHTAWTNNSITATLNMTGLTIHQATWLYVFAADGTYIIKQLRGGDLGEVARKTATFQYDGAGNLPVASATDLELTAWTSSSQDWTTKQYNLVGEHGLFITQASWLWDPYFSRSSVLGKLNKNLVDSLRVPTRNPNIRILGYTTPQDIGRSFGQLGLADSLFASASWDSMARFHMHTTLGDTCWRDPVGTTNRRMVINLSKNGAPTAFAGLIYDFFTKTNNTNKGSGFGVFFDDFITYVLPSFIPSVATMDVNENGTGYNLDSADRALWITGLIATVDTLKAKMATAGYNDFMIIANNPAWAKANNDTTLLSKIDGVLFESYPDYLLGVSPCPSEGDFSAAIGSAVSAYNKPSDIRSLLSTDNGGPYVVLMNITYPIANLELLSLMSDSSPMGTSTDWITYTKQNSIQMASGSEFNATYPYISDYIGNPTGPVFVDDTPGTFLFASRTFDRGNIQLQTQPTTFSQTLPTTLCSPSASVTITGANNPIPFYAYTIMDYSLPSNNIRNYTYVPPLGTIHATYDWTAPTTGEPVSYYLVQHSTDNGVTWISPAYQTIDSTPAYTIHAVRTLHNIIRIAGVDITGRPGPWSLQSIDYIPTANEVDPGDLLE
jgi:hypothetical protein